MQLKKKKANYRPIIFLSDFTKNNNFFDFLQTLS